MKRATPIKSTLLLTFVLAIFSQISLADPPVWSFPNTKWYELMETGNLMVGNDSGISMVDGATGKALWQRADLKGIKEDEVTELQGTPILILADNSGTFVKKTKITAIDTLTGKTIWDTEKVSGFNVNVSVNYEKDMVVFLTILNNKISRDKPDIYALRLSTGEFLWHTESSEKVELYGKEVRSKWKQLFGSSGKTGLLGGGGLFGNKNNNASEYFDLHGENPPFFDGDSMYMTYAGLHRYNLADGKLVWGQKYDVTDGSLNNTNGEAVLDGDTIYTAANGMVRAINKADGSIKWKSKDFGHAISQLLMVGDTLYGRLGGDFFAWKKFEWQEKGPMGVVAINKNTGVDDWIYKGADSSITNLVVLPEDNILLAADNKYLFGLDLSSRGKIKEAYRIKLKFKNKIGFFTKGDRKDKPIQLSRQENGLVTVRGKHHVLGFDPKSKEIVWSNSLAVPSMSFWDTFVQSAIASVTFKFQHEQLTRNLQAGWYKSFENNPTLTPIFNAYQSYMTNYYANSKSLGRNVYFLTTLKGLNEKGKEDKGSGVVGINLMTGKAANQIMFKDKDDTDYAIDEYTGRLFNMDKNAVACYNINQTAEQTENDDKEENPGND